MRARAAWAAIIAGLIGVCIAKGLLEQVNIDSSDAWINCDVSTILAGFHDCDLSSDRWIGCENIKQTGRVYVRRKGEAIISAYDYIEGDYWHASEGRFFPFIKIFLAQQNAPFSLVSMSWKEDEPGRTRVLRLTRQGLFSDIVTSIMHFLDGIHVGQQGEHCGSYPSLQCGRQANICQNKFHRNLGNWIESERPGNARINREPWAASGLHLVQLAFHGSQLAVGDNRLGDSDAARDYGKNSDYPGSIGSYSGRPLLGGFLLVIGAALLKIAFYFGDTPRPDRNDRWLTWGTGIIAAVMICQGVVLALTGIWLF